VPFVLKKVDETNSISIQKVPVITTVFTDLVGKVVKFYLSSGSPPPLLFTMLDLNGLFFFSIVWDTFIIEIGGGRTSE